MRNYLLPESGTFYKANLHAHTNMSDGSASPEEVKARFLELGYSIVAYTDHDVFVDRSHLADESFLPLNGVELEINGRDFGLGWATMETCHINMIAIEPDNLITPCYHRTKYLYANAPKYRHLMQYDDSLPDYERFYTPECISAMLLEGRRRGFFTVYNHPSGSLESYPQYINYHYMHAMEMYNGMFEYNPRVYDDMLRSGNMIYCVGGDDSHNRSRGNVTKHGTDGCGYSWTMIKAEKLDYRTVTQALLDGNFYCSQGPEIYELYVEDNVLHIKTSDAREIRFNTPTRFGGANFLADEGEFLNEAEYKIRPECLYVRVTVVGPNGRTASTNAYKSVDIIQK
ncbi:MAG: hypothetical protein IJW92_06335 [Clostridia bacterium]|nr:hypothetical protein [Clostridia bacterium]